MGLKSQLETLLAELKTDDISKAIIKKYSLKEGYTKEIRNEIRKMCRELQIKEEWLYKLFGIESNGNPQAVNYQKEDKGLTTLEKIKKGRAVGLIQWMPNTAKLYNTTTEEIYHMSISEQLVLVKQYIKKAQSRYDITSFSDAYLAVFYPYAINEPNTFVLGSEISTRRAAIVAKQNKGIDQRHGNNDGLLTKQEICNWVS